jgi:hypothetical protein
MNDQTCFNYLKSKNKVRKKDYFFAGWIANLGVVPLLRSWALRRLPIFLRLLARRISVIFVFDTIKLPPNNGRSNVKLCFLHWPPAKVKLVTVHHVAKSIILGAQVLSSALVLALEAPEQKEIVLSIGEHYEIPLIASGKFAIGNRDIIAHKLNTKKQVLLIKGKKIGHTDLMIWPSGTGQNTKTKGLQYQIFIISKREQLKIGQLNQLLKKLNLETSLQGPPFTVRGEINNVPDYLQLIATYQRHQQDLHLQVSLTRHLQRKILGSVYAQLLNEYVEIMSCHFQGIHLNCGLYTPDKKLPEIATLLAKEWGIKFSINEYDHGRNYLARLKIIQIEANELEDINWGLSELKSTWHQWFGQNPVNYASTQAFQLAQKNNHLRILAEPEIILRPGKEVKIQVGQQFTYQIPDNNLQRGGVEWKFSGLEISLIAKKYAARTEIIFETNLTKPEGENVNQLSSSKESSTAVVDLNNPISIFDITLESSGQAQTRLPWLARLPILGKIFQSNSKAKGHTKITGVLMLSREDISATKKSL